MAEDRSANGLSPAQADAHRFYRALQDYRTALAGSDPEKILTTRAAVHAVRRDERDRTLINQAFIRIGVPTMAIERGR